MIPKEEAQQLVFNMYYYLLDSDDRQIRAKELAIVFCKKILEELDSLPDDLMVAVNVKYWNDVIIEIKAL